MSLQIQFVVQIEHREITVKAMKNGKSLDDSRVNSLEGFNLANDFNYFHHQVLTHLGFYSIKK